MGEQKVPAWSADGRFLAHWQGVEMTYMSRFTGVVNYTKDALIAQSFHVWVVNAADGSGKTLAGPGDDPTFAPDGRVTRAYPDPTPVPHAEVQIQSAEGQGWEELPILPRNCT